MVDFNQAIENLQRDFVCAALGIENQATPWLNNAIRSIPGSRARPLTDADRRPYNLARRRACRLGRDPANPSVVYPPALSFPGGQCAGVSYDVTYQMERFDVFTGAVTGIQTYSFTALGPMSGVYYRDKGPSGFPEDYRKIRFSWEMTCNGVVQRLNMFGSPERSGRENPPPYAYKPKNMVVTRVGGAADNCGDMPLPGLPGAPGAPGGGGTIDYDGPDGTPVSEPINIRGGRPILSPGGALIIPTEVCFASFCLDVNLDLSLGGVTVNIGGNRQGGACCPPIGDMPELPSGDDPPPPPSEARYAGVIVTSAIAANSKRVTESGDGVGPNLYIPRLGVIRFAVEIGARRSWTIDYPVKSRSQFIPVESGQSVYDWDVLAEEGVTMTVVGVPVAS